MRTERGELGEDKDGEGEGSKGCEEKDEEKKRKEKEEEKKEGMRYLQNTKGMIEKQIFDDGANFRHVYSDLEKHSENERRTRTVREIIVLDEKKEE